MASFSVRIQYREPTYERSTGEAKASPYSCRFEVAAADPVEALRRALLQFDSLQRLSSVGWVREVVRIEIDVPAQR